MSTTSRDDSAEAASQSCLIRPFPHLAVVGASARAAAESVYFSGRSAVVADLFADADLRRLCSVERITDYPQGLVSWLESTECDAWFYTGALENHPELVDRLAQVRPLMGNSGNTLRRVRDPLALQAVCQRASLPFPETHTATASFQQSGPWLAKTYRGSSGNEVAHWNRQATGYAQRRIEGQSGSALFAGGTLLGITRQLVGKPWTGASEFQYCGSLAPWNLARHGEHQIRQIGQEFVREFDLQGLFGVDFLYDGTDVWPMEVNPRYTASLETLELAYPLQVIDWHLSTCQASGLQPLAPPSSLAAPTCVGKAIWFAKQPLEISSTGSQWALAQNDLSDIPGPGTRIDAGQPVMTVRAEYWTSEQTESVLRARIESLENRFGQ